MDLRKINNKFFEKDSKLQILIAILKYFLFFIGKKGGGIVKR